ncbi:unnamed protein product [Ectocarpus sp. 12 AP-2014]
MYGFAEGAEVAALDTADRLRELRGSGAPAVAVAAAAAHELSLEKDTWALLLIMNGVDKEDEDILEGIRRQEEEGGDATGSNGAPPGPNASDEAVLDSMRARDSEFRRTEAVVEWLQGATHTRLNALGLGGGEGEGHLGWSDTLESLAVGGGQKSEVAQMYPDANLRRVSRGGMKVMRLVGQDDLDEENLLRSAWALVRAGRLSAAKRLCEKRGQPWRAAAMAGGGVVGTRVMEGEEERELEEIEAGYGALYSPGQGLWQEMCWQLSVSLERGADSSEGPARSVAKHEAALFAHLAGNAELLLESDLTQSWQDQAWVRFSALLHLKVLDERIQHRRVQAARSALYPGVSSLRTDERLLEQMARSGPPTSHGAIFEVLDDNSRGRVRAEGKGVYRQAQQALVLGGRNIPLFLRNILWRVAAGGAEGADGDSGAEEGRGVDDGFSGSPRTEDVLLRSPQLLRFAAHLALVLAAQCPYLTTMEEGTLEAVEDVVHAYAKHLAKAQQVGLVAIYASTLPTRRRRDLYAGFLRSLEGDGSRHEALEQAKSHMPRDVPAILKKVVEDVRRHTVSVASSAMPKQVPEGDLKKIKAMSWLLDYPDTQAEAVVQQANALARHLVLQTYQQSVIGGGSGVRGGGLLSWAAAGGGDEADHDESETPTVLSARLEAVQKLLESVASSSPLQEGRDARRDGAVVVAGAAVNGDAGRERECWAFLLGAREAYLAWAEACRGEGGMAGAGEENAVRDAAGRAMAAFDEVLTYEDGWMYPQDPAIAADDNASLGSWVDLGEGSDEAEDAGAAVAVPNNSMVVSLPVEYGVGGDDVGVSEEERKAKEVAEARRKREREEEEAIRAAEETASRAEEAARREELLGVRAACLPGLVFLAHEVAHSTGLWMLRWRSANAAEEWFTRGQKLANTIVKDKYRTLLALNPGHMRRLLGCVERSTTKLLECSERGV